MEQAVYIYIKVLRLKPKQCIALGLLDIAPPMAGATIVAPPALHSHLTNKLSTYKVHYVVINYIRT